MGTMSRRGRRSRIRPAARPRRGRHHDGRPAKRYLFALGYPDEALADAALAELHELSTDNYLKVADWAIVTKAADGKVKTRESTGSDAGAARGAVAGGVAGALLVMAGPIGGPVRRPRPASGPWPRCSTTAASRTRTSSRWRA